MVDWRADSGRGADQRGCDPLQHRRDSSPHRHLDNTRVNKTRRSPRSPRRVTQSPARRQSPQRQNPTRGPGGDRSPRRQNKRPKPSGRQSPVASRHQSPSRQRSPQRSWTQRKLSYTRGHQNKDGRHHFHDPNVEETTAARLEVFSIVLHVIVATASLMVTVPLAMVTSGWDFRRERCPLFVDVPPGFSIRWGNEDLTPCKLTAFLPIIVFLLSATMLLFHCGLLHVWRTKGEPPTLASSRLYTLVTLAIAIVQALIALCIAITLTEGFRQTCIAFDLNLSWNEVVYSCKENYDDRDQAYGLGNLHTFAKIVTGLVGGWIATITTMIITIVYMLRARLCWCQLLCI